MMSRDVRWRLLVPRAAAAALALWAACLTGCQPCGDCGRCQPKAASPAPAREFAIEGMTCEGCVQTITAALKAVPGVKSAEVSLQDKKATVVADEAEAPASRIEAAVSQAGYKATALPASPAPK